MFNGKPVVYENKNYALVVGLAPPTVSMPTPIDAYLVFNKETGVMESWQGVLFYAKQEADLFNDLLENPPRQKEEKEELVEQKKFSFN